MPLDKELKKVLKLGIKTIVFQEIRLLRMEQAFTPEIVLGGISQSIEETKREIARLTRTMSHKERASLLKKMIRQAADEEIDRAIQLRKNRCLRCIHGRFYDRSEVPYSNLPLNENLVQTFGCDQLRPALRKTCRRFVETSTTPFLEEYLNEIAFLYEFREMVDRMEEIWKDFLSK
ncbi:MAG: hypothetical protein QME83_03770 [Thermodesulfobacteriota bacterium]|nr:hypothetical protein [Thermodesulfobacteriota bacterium]